MTQMINIRKRRISDLSFIIRVIRGSFPYWYTRLPFLFLPTFIAELDNRRAGFITVLLLRNHGKIMLLAVDKHSCKQNVGKFLLKFALEYFKKLKTTYCTAMVRVDNKEGLAFYNKVDFRVINIIHRPFLRSVYLIKKDL
ncbi:GNAT family N-acetyltransferase [Candidatus Omnitrophota bacterium]